MTYIVVKTIKGHRYRYEQETYRVGSRVRTISRYLGPDDGLPPGGYSGHDDAPEHADQVNRGSDGHRGQGQGNGQGRPLDGSSGSGRASASPVAGTTPTTSQTPSASPVRLDVKVKLEKYSIGETALWAEHKGVLRRLERMGLDTSRFPSIRLRYGLRVAHKRQAYGEGYVVTLPHRQTGNRNHFKREFSRALVRGSLDMIREQKPEHYVRMAEVFDRSYRSTQAALSAYILSSNDRLKQAKVLALKYWGTYVQAARSPLKPYQLGVVDASRRRDWTDEVIQVGAEIQHWGYKRVQSGYYQALSRARSELENAKTEREQYWRLSPRRRRANRRIVRANARVKANAEMLWKVKMVNEWLGYG